MEKTQPGRNGGTLKADAGPGRPPGSFSLTRLIREALEANDEKQAKQLAAAMILQAAKGNGTAIKEIMNRIDGPVPIVTENETTLTLGDSSVEALSKAYGDPPEDDSP